MQSNVEHFFLVLREKLAALLIVAASLIRSAGEEVPVIILVDEYFGSFQRVRIICE